MARIDQMMLGSVELFCLAAESGSFKAAAASAGVTPPAVSRSISRLEQRLKVRLFERSTRQIRLTDEGKLYLARCRSGLDLIADAAAQLSGKQASPSGIVRISMPTGWGHFRVLPLLPLFREQYPEVQLSIELSNRNVDLVGQGVDMAIRSRRLPDSTLVARPLGDEELVLVASPAYLARRGTPATVSGLAMHDCIVGDLPSTGQPMPWTLCDKGTEIEFTPPPCYRCSGDLLGIMSLALQGAGITQLYRFFVQRYLDSGDLVELLPSAGGARRPFSLVYPQSRHQPLRARVLVDFLLKHLASA